jgi:hypothetical protein
MIIYKIHSLELLDLLNTFTSFENSLLVTSLLLNKILILIGPAFFKLLKMNKVIGLIVLYISLSYGGTYMIIQQGFSTVGCSGTWTGYSATLTGWCTPGQYILNCDASSFSQVFFMDAICASIMGSNQHSLGCSQNIPYDQSSCGPLQVPANSIAYFSYPEGSFSVY